MSIFHVQWRGTVPGGEDIWLAGWHGQSDDDAPAVASLVAGATPGLFASRCVGVGFGNVRVSEIDEGSGNITAVAEASIAAVTPAAGNSLPPGVAVAVTLRPVAGLQTGRFYLPPLAANALDVNGKLITLQRDSIANAMKTFFQTTLGSASSPLRVGIYSRKNHNFVGAARVEVGNVFDSQRRRRNKILESRIGFGIL